MSTSPPTDLQAVLDAEIKEWHFHIYFHQKNVLEKEAALNLRDAVLRLRRDGAFVAVPLHRVNVEPIGPHPAGSYEIWVPAESFSSVFSYLALHRGELSILVHPLTKEARADHDVRNAWIGAPFPLDLYTLPLRTDEIPIQYPALKMGYSTTSTGSTIEERMEQGDKVERVLANDKEAASAPPRT